MKIISKNVTITIRNNEYANKYISSCKSFSVKEIDEVIDRIIKLTAGLNDFWRDAEGWAPLEAAKLISKSRLDWQLSLANCLRLWINEPINSMSSGSLILAWANLGSLVEGGMKLFLSVWYEDYKTDIDAIKKKKKVQDPDGLQLEPLKQYFDKKIWDKTWTDWVAEIQQKRNAIHAYKDKEIGTLEDFKWSIVKYLDFLRYINYRLPYPDDVYVPQEI